MKKSGITRIPSGIPGLDELIEGGFVKNSTIMIRGDIGTAKTLFSLQYLYHGATHNEAGAFISFAESCEALYQHGRKFGWNLDALAKKDKFAVVRYEPHEVIKIMEEGGGLIRDTLELIDAKRLVIDSLTAYEMFFEKKYKANQSILSLFELLNKWEVTTLVTSEFPVNPDLEANERLGFLTDGIINLYHSRCNSKRCRRVEIIKMRDTSHNEEMNSLVIEKTGLRVTKGSGKVGKK